MAKPKVYLLCDWSDEKARRDNGTPNCGVEFLGNCHGRVVAENGSVLGQHYSSTAGWLRSDLIGYLEDPSAYEIVDLIGQDVPERFREVSNG